VDWGYNSIPIARSRIAGSKSLTRNLAPFQHLAPIQLRHDEPIFSDLSNRIRIAISIREQVAIQVLTIASAQGCRHHKVENVMGYLPEHLKAQVKAALRGAFLLPAEEGMARLEKQAQWLEREYPDAAASLRERFLWLITDTAFTLNARWFW
jgi:Transposase, Mutator family